MNTNNKLLAFFTVFLPIVSTPSYALDAVDVAAQQIGKEYVLGENGPLKFDCSGLTWYAFGTIGIELDLTANSQYSMSQGLLLDHPYVSDLQRGDLVFFETDPEKPGVVTHVGIYEGNNMMISAEWYGTPIRRADLTSPYWNSRFVYARRMPTHNGTPSSNFSIGNLITISQDQVNVRHLRQISSPVLGTRTTGDAGTVIFGPAKQSIGGTSYWWWLIDFDNGVDGWVAEDYLIFTNQITNHPPIASNDDPGSTGGLSTPEDTALVISPATLLANDSDPDGDSLTITGVSNPSHGSVELNSGTIIFTPDANYNGPAQFTYSISDGRGGTASAAVSIDVAPVNNPPIATNDSTSIIEDAMPNTTSGYLLSNDFDPDGDTLTIIAINGSVAFIGAVISGSYGSLVLNSNGSYTYTLDNSNPAVQALALGETLTEVFSYTASDGHGGSGNATLTITINGADDSFSQILNGSMVTNTNVAQQTFTLTFVDANNTLNAYAKLFALSGTGQASSLTEDTGFVIDPAHQFAVSLEQNSANTNKVIVTDFNLEGVDIITGVTQFSPLGANDGSGAESGMPFARIAVITPGMTTPNQAPIVSKDGTGSANTITDTDIGNINYLFGAGGNDTLAGSSEPDFINGGTGADSLLGGAGNDTLVYDALDTEINGGDGFDILRLDNSVNLTSNTMVRNIEILLFSDDPASSPSVGSTVTLSVIDVINMTDSNHKLFVRGNPGDTLNIGTGWSSAASSYAGFALYQQAFGGNLVQLYVEGQVTVTTIPL